MLIVAAPLWFRPFHDRVCKPVTECAADEFEVSAPTPFEDRVCEKKATCDVRCCVRQTPRLRLPCPPPHFNPRVHRLISFLLLQATTFKLEHHKGGEVVCIKLRQVGLMTKMRRLGSTRTRTHACSWLSFPRAPQCNQFEDEIVAPTATTDR